MMRLSLKALACAGGVLWGALILGVGLLQLADPGYGVKFLPMTPSLYPGFHMTGPVGSLVLLTVEGFLDGAIGGLILAWLVNSFMHLPTEVTLAERLPAAWRNREDRGTSSPGAPTWSEPPTQGRR